MNYLLFHVGKLPSHFYTCVNNIMSIDKDSKIYLLTDKDINIKPVESINLNNFENLIEIKNEIIEIYKGTNLESNPLWYASFLRVFGLKTVASEFKLDKFIHFDNDVLIYKSFNEILSSGSLREKSINITENDHSRLVFGYSYFDDEEQLDYLIRFFRQVLANHQSFSDNYHRGKPLSEMRILKLAQENKESFFSILPSLPYEGNEIIFDPASYGQYLHGSHLKRGNYIFKRRWVSTDHIVGSELKSKRIKFNFNKGTPTVDFEKSTSYLANLHIHSKYLNKFINKQFKNYLI